MIETLNETRDAPYWDRFYAQRQTAIFPSQFACMVASMMEKPAAVVDLGCGNGRDSFFFAQLGNAVLGLDKSAVAVQHDREAASRSENAPAFAAADFEDPAAVRRVVEPFFTAHSEMARVFYCRFVLHSITDDAEEILFSTIRPLIRPGDRFFGEFRTAEDMSKPKIFGNHFRRFLDFEAFLSRSEGRGLRAHYSAKGVGMAVYRDEDPVVGRVVLQPA